MSLRWRLALVVGAIAALAIALASAASYLSTQAELNNTTDDFLRARALEFVDDRRGSDRRDGGRGQRTPAQPPRPLSVDEPDAVTQILDPNGDIIVQGFPELPVDDAARQTARSGASNGFAVRDAGIQRTEVDGESLDVITVPLPQGGAIQIGRDVSESERVLDALRNRLIIIGMAGTAAAALLAWFVAVGISRPLRRLSGAAEMVATTQALDTRIEVARQDEVGRLAESFNTMLQALDTSRRQQRQLVDDASHELRTPLTSLRTNIEMLDRADALEPEDRARLLADVTFELDQLAELVDEVVQSAVEVDRATMAIVEVEVDRLVQRVADRAERRFGRPVQVDARPAIVSGSPDLIERAVANLVGNADKFSPEGGGIDITVRCGERVEITVRDRGPGVSDDQIEAIFERFHRTPAARGAPGSGHGLAIVRQIAEAHDGEVAASRRDGGGLAVTMRLPPAAGS